MTALERADADEAQGTVDRLVRVYLEVYAGGPDDQFFGEDRYRRQLAGHMTAPGWEVVTATDDGELAGYIYGFTLPSHTGWWRWLTTPVDDTFTTETGKRTLAISELMVRERWRGHGLARRLHDEMLSGRREERATLLVLPDNTRAQDTYARWGWRKVAEMRPNWENSPLWDVLILPLGER